MLITNIKEGIIGELKGIYRNILHRGVLKRTIKLKDSKINKDAVVIGGGPSVRKLDYAKFKSFVESNSIDVITVNNYFITDLAGYVKSDYHVESDPEWFIENWKGNEKGGAFYKRIKKNNERIKSSNIPLFAPLKFIKYTQDYKEVYYYNDEHNYYRDYGRNIMKPRNFPSLSGIKGIRIADYLGYKTIYIIGIDSTGFMDFNVNKDNILYKYQNHYYDHERVEIQKKQNVAEYLIDKSKEFYSYHDINKYSSNNIINLDIDSYVDAFKKDGSNDIYKI